MRNLLEPYYEQKFSDHSHGFRPNRGCHTALNEIRRVWHGTSWFIEGDIKGCFDNIDHTVLLHIIQRDIHDGRLVALIANLLKAGYIKGEQYYETTSGTPQGGIISPLLANIYLNELDRFVEDTLIPEYTRGIRRASNPEYDQLNKELARVRRQKIVDIDEIRRLRQARRAIPSVDTRDPDYRRLRFVRYADDFLLGFAGPKNEAEEIRDRIKVYLQDELKLELSVEKTLVTHATTDKAKFLGYEIAVMRDNTQICDDGRRAINGGIQLMMPPRVAESLKAKYSKKGKVVHKAELINDADHTIVTRYQSVLRGLYNYYCMAPNVSRQMQDIRQTLEMSLTKTLAHKHKCTVNTIYKLYGQDTEPRSLTVITSRPDKTNLAATFGGIPFKRIPTGSPEVRDYPDLNARWFAPGTRRSEAVDRLKATQCELCGGPGPLQAHHVRKLTDISASSRAPKPQWMQIMIARQRKRLMVCEPCHKNITAGYHDGPTTRHHSLESRVR